jgi:hypothetical protein
LGLFRSSPILRCETAIGKPTASEETPQGDQVPRDSTTDNRPWQFSLRSLLMFTAIVAALLVAAKILGNVADRKSSKVAGLFVWLILIQFFGGCLLAPGDTGAWLCTMQRLYLVVDIFLFARLCVFCQIARRPEPQLSRLTRIALLTSPVWMAVVATYLMETYHFFR